MPKQTKKIEKKEDQKYAKQIHAKNFLYIN